MRQILYSETVFEFNDIIDTTNEIWNFNWGLLRSLDLKSNEISSRIGKDVI